MLLSYNELCEVVDQGVITNVTPERINAASIDITLAETLWIEKSVLHPPIIDLSAKPREYPPFEKIWMGEAGRVIEPGQFLLASSQEEFNLPDDLCANYFLNSSLARAGLNAALAMWCLTGDTLIPLLDGTKVPIEDLAGRQAWLYSVDDAGRTVPGFASKVWQTREVTDLIELILDDHSVVRCTPEHMFRLRSGAWASASDLSVGTPLMSVPRKYDAYNGTHELVYSPVGFRRKWVATHGMVDRELYGELPKGYVVHHIDHNPYNNQPNNLVRMTMAEHVKHHHDTLPGPRREALSQQRSEKAQRQNQERWASSEARQAMSVWATENNVAQSMQDFVREHKDVWYVRVLAGYVRKTTETLIARGLPVTPDNYITHKRQNAPTIAKLESVFGSFESAVEAAEYRNHRVIGLRELRFTQPIPVYDMTVEKHHSFVLDNGLVSHNCDPGWYGSTLTLELKNWLSYNRLLLRPGMKIGQVVFHRVTPVPEERSYKTLGSYNDSQGPSTR